MQRPPEVVVRISPASLRILPFALRNPTKLKQNEASKASQYPPGNEARKPVTMRRRRPVARYRPPRDFCAVLFWEDAESGGLGLLICFCRIIL